MLNDRNDKYDGSDDSEYHFSDDEVNHDVDSGSANQSPVGVQGGGYTESVGRSKKMIVVTVIFLALVFVVYKMAVPDSSAPPTEIAPQAVVASQPKALQQLTSSVQPAAEAPVAPPSTMQQGQQIPANQQAVEQMPAIAQQPVAQMLVAAQQQPVAQMPVAAQQQPVAQPASAVQESSQVEDAAYAQQTQQARQAEQVMQTSVNNAMSQAIPAQSPPPAATSMPSTQAATDPNSSLLVTENVKLSGQLQVEYAQRLSDYQSQNKNLQDQVQTLNTRVASMETEMNQLMQTLTQQFQSGGNISGAAVAVPQTAAPEQAAPLPKVPYNVQAIIPGRAWLRANNGDTLTVAEGDEIKGVGRVTKIDPYDGVVEINVQGRAVSLSYGNGG